MSIPVGVIAKFLSLLRELKRHYGDEEVIRIWDNLQDVIDDEDLKMELFKAMLNGGTTGTNVNLKFWDSTVLPVASSYTNSKVPAIKLYREITGLGLKESKDFVEAAEMGKSKVPQESTMPISERHFVGATEFGSTYTTHPDYKKWLKDAEDVGLYIEFI